MNNVNEPAEALSEGFPGPLITGVCLIAAPILGVIGSALAIGVYSYKGADMIREMADHHARGTAGMNFAVAGVALMVFAVTALARAICTRRATLGRAAGTLTILGLAGPLFFEGMYWGASYLTAPSRQAAGAHMINATEVIPSTIVNVSGPALILGFILLAVGAAKSGLLSRSRSVALGLTALLPVGFISGFIVLSAIGFALAAIALVPLGLSALRSSGRVPATVPAR